MNADNHQPFSQQFGQPSERARGKIKDWLFPWAQEFVSASPFLVLSPADADGRSDASPRGGEPGFVEVLDERTLDIPDVRGNRLFQSLTNLGGNPNLGLLFMIPGLDETLRVNGSGRVVAGDDQADARVQNPDATAVRLQSIRVVVEEVYIHCPRAFRFSDLWSTTTIEQHRAERPIGRYRVD